MKKLISLILLGCLLMAFFLVLPTLAQDGELTEDADSVVVDAPAVGVVSDVGVNMIQVIIGLLGAFAAGGVVGIAGLSVFVDRLRNDTPTIIALEKLAESYPPGTRELLLNVSKSVDAIGELGKEVFDGVPITDKFVPAGDGLGDSPLVDVAESAG